MADHQGISDDSSEEPEEDEDEARRIREGFIVDEDEDEEEDDDEARARRRKRRKRRHRRREEEEALEEDDLELLEENTGTSFRNRLTRLRRGPEGGSPPVPSSSKRKPVVESSEDDLDDEDMPQVQDIQRIWDDERAGGGREDEEDMDDFIDYEDEDEGAGAMDEQEREERRRERKKRERERRRALGSRPELAGIDDLAWDEIHGVFGDGHDYDWALAGDDEMEFEEERLKPEMRYQDVFEPSEIRARMLTEDDDLIRAQDIPERMQLATSSLSQSSTLSLHQNLTEADLDDAAMWVTVRLSTRKTRDFFSPDGPYNMYREPLVMAVTYALRYLFVQEFEVPYVWTHKRDYISYFNPQEMRTRVQLISLPELWRIYALGQKYRSLAERRNTLAVSYTRLGVEDEYFEQTIRPKIDSVEVVTDATEWLTMKYKLKKQDAFDFHFHDDEDQVETRKRKTPSRISAYEIAKKSIVSKLADGFGIKPHDVVYNFVAQENAHFVDDQELNPIAFAEQFTDLDATVPQTAEDLLRRARMILATELGKDPLLRQAMRDLFKTDALISVLPTERGLAKIDDHHPYFNFKYLHHKSITQMMDTPQFLHILAAEAELLVTVSMFLTNDAKSKFERRLNDAFASDSYSDTARAWNEERSRVVQEALEQHLVPVGVKWAREWLREEVEDTLAAHCGNVLRKRVDVAPYITPEMKPGDTASVLAVSWGKGDPQKDAITLVFLDEAGRLREHIKIDNLVDQDYRDEFTDLLKRRRPDVIVVGGFSMATTKLASRVKVVVNGDTPNAEQTGNGADGWGAAEPRKEVNEQAFNIPVLYVRDEVARMYQHSRRAAEEFSALSPVAKYCVGLARYAQSPLNEYAALGQDISAITFEDEDQHLIPKEKLMLALERTLVDVTNKVGVDINRAVNDSYHQHLLPFVCGLGPRKAQVLVKKIAAMGGNLVNRDQFIKSSLLTTKIFLNAAGFLRISRDPEVKLVKNRHADDDVQDPLDDTRIHPEDYDLARKMATDALELDEEDIHDEHPSHVVSLIMQDSDNERKLNELNLDEFAVSMYEANEDRKRHTLNVIREELLKPFSEQRAPFPSLEPWDVLTMLSGETPRTLRMGLIVSVLVVRIDQKFVLVRLDSGIEGVINIEYVTEEGNIAPKDSIVKKGQTIQGVIVEVKLNLPADQFFVDLSVRQSDLKPGDTLFRRVKRDDHWNVAQFERDSEMQARKKRAEIGRTRRVIKHPNFHNFNASQAENYLDKQQRGDVVIRPSSKGVDHLAVTWKVDDKLYQHIDVTEINTGHGGALLVVDEKHQYADLDELIVNHVQATARKVEELMAHEKFKHGSEDELHLFLKNFVAANPAKSIYGFTLNRRKPGHFNLCFLANKNSTVQTWPVRVMPESYCLFEAAVAGVPELCDAFKVRHLHQSQNLAGSAAAAAGGKTPYAGARTPARTPAHPGHMSIRQAVRTPNPYGGQTPAPGIGGPGFGPGAASSSFNMPPPQASFGYQTPAYSGPPPGIPPGMNPQRAAMIQNTSWGQESGWS
ncbi:transcription elongation factor Spt6 [Rhizopogon vinicolor AM-OR11-026]|uniref:Transcription elongation factor Spt6 n=1 Tax=Rhizopogon vinicolor AM-OR11-026 TaxID=1314800 RepID=A0A1B7NAQ8_9AGAM|nr:transcription elongation factor Spt6 [Rhizopogon vinicolor AM-OR11-026]